MVLEAELRQRVEQSSKELEEIIDSLQHIKRLADSQQSSTEQLAKVAKLMEEVAKKLGTLQVMAGQSESALQTAVESVKAADWTAIIKQIRAVGARLENAVQLGESGKNDLASLKAGLSKVLQKIEAASREQAAAIEKIEKSLEGKFEEAGVRFEALEKRIGNAVTAAWVAAVMAAGAAAVGVFSLLR
ncbi:hypothetical protein [Desulfofustis limnaeus]|uniref:DUF1640 domain-containing protein n=1 Tax=Desulfofustis limnaeus TaxID=2740163 RepID=A0ABM7WCX9_9BACT|nr:hypothetical protein [Desulfofustis limnaeus]BDD88844.1 hypothetical protein DPPLL_32090 [Desulfofustis limnaeus]